MAIVIAPPVDGQVLTAPKEEPKKKKPIKK